MTPGVSGSFDIAGTLGFSARIFYAEKYDKLTGKRQISITGISIQSTMYGGRWWPGGSISIDGSTLKTMAYNDPATHSVYVNAGETWYELSSILEENAFPWVSGEIASDPDGNKSITIALDITLYRDSSSPKPTISGSVSIPLTWIPRGLGWIYDSTEFKPHQSYVRTAAGWTPLVLGIGNGTEWNQS